MATLRDQIVDLLKINSGRTDREIAELLNGRGTPQQPVNQACRLLQARGIVARRRRDDGLIGNFLNDAGAIQVLPSVQAAKISVVPAAEGPSEDDLKRSLVRWLEGAGWTARVAWAKERGIDIEATKGDDRWIIEVKGIGSRQAMRVNYFLAILGETLQRMSDPNAQYSIALPDVPQFRGLWARLPDLAKRRTGISALFVSTRGDVTPLN